MNNFRNLEALDMLSVMSFVVQMQNLEEDKQYKGSVQEFEKTIVKEIDQLHKENDLILDKLEEIQKEINKMEYI